MRVTTPNMSHNETVGGNAVLAMAAQRAQTYADAAHAPGTLSVYRRAWQGWTQWCADMGTQPLPADPQAVAAWLAELARQGKSMSRVTVCLSAVLHGHRSAGHALDGRHPSVSTVMRGIARMAARPIRRAAPVTIEILEAALSRVEGHDVRSLRDRAILLVAFWGALRRSEVTALDITGRSPITITADGLILQLTATKTSRKTETVAIPRGQGPLCAVAAVETYLAASGIRQGPLFRAISKSGRLLDRRLDTSSIAHILARLFGDSRGRFSPHSLRAGFVTAAAKAGAPEHTIQRTTRHRSVDVLRRYIRADNPFRENAGSYLR